MRAGFVSRGAAGAIAVGAVGSVAAGGLAIVLSWREAGRRLPLADILDIVFCRHLTDTAPRCALFSFGLAGVLLGAAMWHGRSLGRSTRRWLPIGAALLALAALAAFCVGLAIESTYSGP